MSGGKWIQFEKEPRAPNRKTETWCVVTNYHECMQSVLGVVKWHAPWRCYAFFPRPDTLYEQQCLHDIAEFCKNATISHREAAKARRAANA